MGSRSFLRTRVSASSHQMTAAKMSLFTSRTIQIWREPSLATRLPSTASGMTERASTRAPICPSRSLVVAEVEVATARAAAKVARVVIVILHMAAARADGRSIGVEHGHAADVRKVGYMFYVFGKLLSFDFDLYSAC